MLIELNPSQQERIEEALRSGAYCSDSEVINRALEVLRAQDEWLTLNRSNIEPKISTGIAELERGEGIPDEQVTEYLDRLKAQPE